MKKILTTIVLAAGITLCFGQWQQNPQRGGGPNHYPDYPQQNGNYNQNSSLIINTVSQRPLSVSVDNQQYQSNVNSNTLNVGQINSGNHKIVVYEEKRNFWGKQVQNIVYNSTVNLRPGYETTISINSFGQANISERQLSSNNTSGQSGYGKKGNNGNNGKGHAYGKYKNKHHKDQDGDEDDDDDNNGKNDWNKGGKKDRD